MEAKAPMVPTTTVPVDSRGQAEIPEAPIGIVEAERHPREAERLEPLVHPTILGRLVGIEEGVMSAGATRRTATMTERTVTCPADRSGRPMLSTAAQDVSLITDEHQSMTAILPR